MIEVKEVMKDTAFGVGRSLVVALFDGERFGIGASDNKDGFSYHKAKAKAMEMLNSAKPIITPFVQHFLEGLAAAVEQEKNTATLAFHRPRPDAVARYSERQFAGRIRRAVA